MKSKHQPVEPCLFLTAQVFNAFGGLYNTRFRKIRMKNPAFEARVNRHPGGIDCLLAFGFKRQTVEGEDYLIMSEADAKRGELRQVNQDLQAAFHPGKNIWTA